MYLRRAIVVVVLGLLAAGLVFLAWPFKWRRQPPPNKPTVDRTYPSDSHPDAPLVRARADGDKLQAAVQSRDAGAVLECLRQRTLTEAERNHLQKLIRQLGDESFDVREKAAQELEAWTPLAAGLLRQAAKSTDTEAAGRARQCLVRGRTGAPPGVLAAALRLVGEHKPPAAAEVLLAYLPFADDEPTADEARTALAAVTLRDGKADDAVLKALEDADPVRRAAAGEALCRAGPRADARRLLHDPDPGVRWRVGLALARAQEKDAVLVLIALLPDLHGEERWQVEELLETLADDQAPAWPASDAAVDRQQYRDAWAEWWRDHGADADLGKLKDAPRPRSHTLLVLLDLSSLAGDVLEMTTEGNSRWRIGGLQYPIAAQMLDAQRVLIAEYNAGRVTERNLNGQVLWEKTVGGQVVAAQRLPSGNTFIAGRNRLLEVDAAGKEVFHHQRPVRDVVAARKRGSQIVLVTHDGVCQRLDSSGKEVKSFPVGHPQVMGAGIDLLPGGRVLLPRFKDNLVVEHDATGKVLWQAVVQSPTAVMRLANGNTLVASTTTRLVIELDRTGKDVWQYQTGAAPVQASRR